MLNDALAIQANEVAGLAQSHAAATEALRQLHPEVLNALQAAGLPRSIHPDGPRSPYGSIENFVKVCITLAEGCMSTGWCNFVWGMHNYLVALYPEAAQQSVWGEAPSTLVSASLHPAGTLDMKYGHGELSGYWRFNSGCDHADWLLLGAMVQDAEPVLAMVPKTDIEIVDTWQVLGLSGTGSKDARCENLRIPQEYMLPASQCLGPYTGLLVLVIAGPIVGGARAAVHWLHDAIEQGLRTGDLSLSRLAEASAKLEAATQLLLADARHLDTNPTPGPQQTLEILRNSSYVAKACNETTHLIFNAAGGTELHDSKPLQRIFRDVTAGCAHGAMRWDQRALDWARFSTQSKG